MSGNEAALKPVEVSTHGLQSLESTVAAATPTLSAPTAEQPSAVAEFDPLSTAATANDSPARKSVGDKMHLGDLYAGTPAAKPSGEAASSVALKPLESGAVESMDDMLADFGK